MKFLLLLGIFFTLSAQAEPFSSELNTLYDCAALAETSIAFGATLVVGVVPQNRGHHQLNILSETLGGFGCRARSNAQGAIQCHQSRLGLTIEISEGMVEGDNAGFIVLSRQGDETTPALTIEYGCRQI